MPNRSTSTPRSAETVNPTDVGLHDARQPQPGDSRQPRKDVALEGFAALADGTTFGLRVLDLSYDGCKVEAKLALLPGVKLKVSMLGLGGALDAVVRWSKDGKAGLKFGNEQPIEKVQKERIEERVPLSADASIRRAGRDGYRVRLFDITRTGCKVEFVERPKQGELLWVKFACLEPVEARVRWVEGFYGGLEFVRPIYPAVFELLVQRLRA